MKNNPLPRRVQDSPLLPAVKKFLCACVSLLVFCAAAHVPLQAQPASPPTLYYGVYDGNPGDAGSWSTNATNWSASESSTNTLVPWVNGDYAFFGVTGLTTPENMQIDPAGIDTPGITVSSADSQFGILQPSGGSITLDSDNARHPGYCTVYLVQGRNLYLNTLLEGTNGIYLTGDNNPINAMQINFNSTTPNTYSGGTYINEEVTATHAGCLGTGPITFAGGLLKTGDTINFPNQVNIVSNIPFGSEGGSITFSGPVNIENAGLVLNVGNITVTLNGVVSGPDLNVINRPGQSDLGFILNGASPNTYSGGTTVSETGGSLSTLLDAQTPGSLGTGNVTVNAPSAGGTCKLELDCGSEMASTATLTVGAGAIVNLNYSGTETINALAVAGIQQAPGVYGAGDINPGGVFTGSGTVTVGSQNSSVSVAITSPANGGSSSELTNLTVTVAVTDSQGTVTNVRLYLNNNLIGDATAMPYEFMINFPAPGPFTLTASAIDNMGHGAASEPVSITVTGPSPTYAPGANLELWLEANQGLVTNDSGVIGWNDQSGNGNDATLGPGASPSVLVSTPNGQPSVHMLGANYDYFAIPNSPSLEITGDIATAMVVQDNAVAGVAAFPWFQGGAYPSPNGFSILGGPPTLMRGDGVANQEYDSSGNFITAGQYYIIIATQTGTTMTQYLNGNFDKTAQFTMTPSDGAGGSQTWIGTRTDYYDVGLSDLAVAEIMIFNTGLQGTALANVQNYLAAKYGFAGPTLANPAPTVAITSPTNGATVGSTATVSVTAADAGGSVVSVQLYMNGNLLATASAPPYQFAVTFQGTGNTTLTAVATDNIGLSSTSAPVSLTISGPPATYNAGANLQLWLRADLGVTTNASGGVTLWADQSGQGNNAITGATGYPPVLVPTAINGEPGIHFYGSDREYLQVANSPSLEITGDIAAFIVAKCPADGSYRSVFYQGGTCGYPSPNAFMFAPGGDPTPNRGTGCDKTQDVYYAPTDVQPNTYEVMGFSQAGTTMTQTLNGLPNGIQSSTITPVDGDGDALMYIGSRGDYYDISTSDMEIAELMIFNTALQGANLTAAQNYLLDKYGYIRATAVQAFNPSLSVARQTNGSILISWPQTFTSFNLQSASTLLGTWTPVSGVVSNQVDVTPVGAQQFYRLKSSP